MHMQHSKCICNALSRRVTVVTEATTYTVYWLFHPGKLSFFSSSKLFKNENQTYEVGVLDIHTVDIRPKVKWTNPYFHPKHEILAAQNEPVLYDNVRPSFCLLHVNVVHTMYLCKGHQPLLSCSDSRLGGRGRWQHHDHGFGY